MKQWTVIGVEEAPLGLWVTTRAVNGKGMFCAGSTEDGKQQGSVGKGFSPLLAVNASLQVGFRQSPLKSALELNK